MKKILYLDFNSDVPIYTQIREEIIKAIASGELKINESLPSVRNMAEEVGINLHTVNKSYNILKDEGYINIDRRKGAVVNKLPLPNSEANDSKIKSISFGFKTFSYYYWKFRMFPINKSSNPQNR